MTCPRCNSTLSVQDKECPECGWSVDSTELPTGEYPDIPTQSEVSSSRSEDIVSMKTDFEERFQLCDEISRDKTGIIYHAWDRELSVKVMLKHFHKYLGTEPLVRKLFSRELIVLRRLSHPGILSGYEVHQTGNDLFLTTEMPIGVPLDKYLQKDVPSTSQIIIIIKNVLDILAYLHSQGVVHRGLCPSQIYMDHENRIKIGGFGHSIMQDLVTVTMHSHIQCEPTYQAPELLMGKDATPASDIYAAGVILAEMLKGSKPWSSNSLMDQLEEKRDPINWSEKLGIDSRLGHEIARTVLPSILEPDPAERECSALRVCELLETVHSNISLYEQEQVPVSEIPPQTLHLPGISCPMCNDQMLPKSELCPSCGLSLPLLRAWRKGSYSVIVDTQLGKNKEGKWRVKFKPRWENRKKMKHIVQLIQGEGPSSRVDENARFYVIASNIDKHTAENLKQMFELQGLYVKVKKTGRLGKLSLRSWAWLTQHSGLSFLIFFLIFTLGLSVTIFLPNYYWIKFREPVGPVLGYILDILPKILLGGVGGVLVLSLTTLFRRIVLLPTSQAHLEKSVSHDALKKLVFTPSQIELYQTISDPHIRQKALKFLDASRGVVLQLLEEANANNESNIDLLFPQVDLIKEIEVHALKLFSTLPTFISERETILIEDLRKLETKRDAVSEKEQGPFEKAIEDLDKTLQRLADARSYRIRVEDMLADVLSQLNHLTAQSKARKEDSLKQQALQVLNNLELLEEEGKVFLSNGELLENM